MFDAGILSGARRSASANNAPVRPRKLHALLMLKRNFITMSCSWAMIGR